MSQNPDGTPIPNNVKSDWDFILRRFSICWRDPTPLILWCYKDGNHLFIADDLSNLNTEAPVQDNSSLSSIPTPISEPRESSHLGLEQTFEVTYYQFQKI